MQKGGEDGWCNSCFDETLRVWNSMSEECLSQEIDIIFGLKYGDEVIQGQRRNADACLMAKVGQLHA